MGFHDNVCVWCGRNGWTCLLDVCALRRAVTQHYLGEIDLVNTIVTPERWYELRRQTQDYLKKLNERWEK